MSNPKRRLYMKEWHKKRGALLSRIKQQGLKDEEFRIRVESTTGSFKVFIDHRPYSKSAQLQNKMRPVLEVEVKSPPSLDLKERERWEDMAYLILTNEDFWRA